MSKLLTLRDLDKPLAEKIYTQNYSPQNMIEGVLLIEQVTNNTEDGYFAELIRLDDKGYLTQFPEFKLEQINRVKMYPGTIKAWHLHLKQDEIWCVTADSHLVVGLLDLRQNSSTKGNIIRLTIGEGKTQLLFIPKGVAHGSVNVSGNKAEILYFVNRGFEKNNPDELRLPWDTLGKEFWESQKD